MSSLGDNVISSVLRETWYAFQQVFGILLSFCEINYVIYFISRPLLHPNMINYFTLKWLHVAFSAFKISYIIWNISSWEVFDTKIMNLWIIEKYFKNDWFASEQIWAFWNVISWNLFLPYYGCNGYDTSIHDERGDKLILFLQKCTISIKCLPFTLNPNYLFIVTHTHTHAHAQIHILNQSC